MPRATSQALFFLDRTINRLGLQFFLTADTLRLQPVMPGVVASSLAYLDAAQPTAVGDDGGADVNRQISRRRRTGSRPRSRGLPADS